MVAWQGREPFPGRGIQVVCLQKNKGSNISSLFLRIRIASDKLAQAPNLVSAPQKQAPTAPKAASPPSPHSILRFYNCLTPDQFYTID